MVIENKQFIQLSGFTYMFVEENKEAILECESWKWVDFAKFSKSYVEQVQQ